MPPLQALVVEPVIADLQVTRSLCQNQNTPWPLRFLVIIMKFFKRPRQMRFGWAHETKQTGSSEQGPLPTNICQHATHCRPCSIP